METNKDAKPGGAQAEADQDEQRKMKVTFKTLDEVYGKHPPTTYLHTLMHLFKGFVGSGAICCS